MGKINVLGFDIANLIAAGEVVDRPASVLKELLENAIDAGGKHITAEIRAGGVRTIRVTDDGCGMSAEDLPIALRRHATSKIKTAEDLNAIMTLGFRGEALAAISAVSNISIISKTREAQSATMLTAEGGTVTDLTEVGAADGTTVLVEELFGRVPARRKFLKKDVTEALACTAQMEKVAMSHPELAFRFFIDGTLKFSTVGDGDVKNVLYAIYGRDFATRLLPVSAETEGVRVEGYVGRSDNSHGNRNMQNVFINGRYIKSKTVMAALERAYTSYMAPERYPVCALYLEIDPRHVDVNVHPAKLEVRFSDERKVFESVYWAVRAALEQNTDRPEMQFSDKGKKPPAVNAFVPIGARPIAQQIQMPPTMPALGKDFVPSPTPPRRAEERTFAAPPKSPSKPLVQELSPSESIAFLERMSAVPGDVLMADTTLRDIPRHAAASDGTTPSKSDAPSPSAPPAATDAGMSPVAQARQESAEAFVPEYRYIGEAFRTYLFVELGQEILVIDQHAAHERILFEEMLRRQKEDGRVASQTMLIPLHITLTREELAAAADDRQELEAVGFSYLCEAGGVSLRAIPANVSPADAQDLFVCMTNELAEGKGNPSVTEAARRERALYQVACKAAIKGGRTYGAEQLDHLIRQVLSLPDITVCPHGRPIAYRLTKRELDKQFDRIK